MGSFFKAHPHKLKGPCAFAHRIHAPCSSMHVGYISQQAPKSPKRSHQSRHELAHQNIYSRYAQTSTPNATLRKSHRTQQQLHRQSIRGQPHDQKAHRRLRFSLRDHRRITCQGPAPTNSIGRNKESPNNPSNCQSDSKSPAIIKSSPLNPREGDHVLEALAQSLKKGLKKFTK